MEALRRGSSADSGIRFLERALSGLSSRSNTSSSSTAVSTETADDLKGPLGLNLLYAPPEALVDFIFVHGLGGGSRKTWAKSNNPYHYWPKEWLPRDPDFKHVRIHAFGYKADWGEKQDSVLNVDDFARALLGDIAHDPGIRRSETAIVLIGHSMGGTVIKKAYILSRQDQTFIDIANRIHTIFFLATPHRGSDLASTLTSILKVTYGGKPFVNDLQKNSGLIHSVNDTFRHYHNDVQLWSFYETLKSTILMSDVMIVDKSSATLGYSNEKTALLNANHRNVVKFDRPSDSNYKTLRNAFSSVVDSIVSAVLASKHEASRNDIEHLRNLIGAIDSPEDDLLTVGENKIPGSCEWLTSKTEFENWRDAWSHAPPIFWLSGMPASGKSILSSHVIDSIEGHNLDCSFFFFKHGVAKKSTLSDLLSSLAYQMAMKNVDVRRQLLHIEADGVTFDKNDERAVWRKLFINGIFLVKTIAPHYWVIDALDECSKIQALFSMLAKIEVEFPLRIFATSRKTQDIEHGMGELGTNVFYQEIQSTDTVGDIQAFITSKMDRLPVEDEEGRLALSQRILEKANGSFLWVRLVVQELEKLFSEEAVTEVLNDIPADMNQLYARTLDGISNSGRSSSKLARVILTWTVCAAKPLKLDEMQSVIKLDANQTIPNLGKSVSSICGQLVIVDQQSRIQMIHQTAKDYLLKEDATSEFAVKKGGANMHLAIKCLEVLSGNALKTAKPRAKKFGSKAASGTKDTALVDYACSYFSDHLYKSSPADPEPLDALYDFLKSNVLNWIEHLAKAGKTYHISRAAANVKAYLDRRAKYYPPLGQQIQTVEAWMLDLIRVSAKFQANLQACPSSIHYLVPPMCPAETIIHKTYTSPHRGLTVKGLTSATWNDCLFQADYRGSQATAISHGEQFFAVGLSTGGVIIYYADSARIHSTLDHGERVRLVEFGSRDKVIASSGFKEVRVWDVAKGQQLHIFKTSRQTLALAFSSENECLMAATQANLVSCWDLEEDDEKKEQISWQGVGEGEISRYMARQPPTHAAFSSERDLLAVAYRGRPILLFNLEEERFFGNLTRHAGRSHEPSHDMIFNPNPDLKLFITSYHDGELAVYNYETIELLHTVPAINAHQLACSPDGRTLVTGSSFGTIQIFDFGGADGSALTLLYKINAYEEGIKEIAFSVNNLRFLDIRGSQCRVWEPAALVRKDLEDGTQSELSDPVLPVAKTVGMNEGDQEPDISAITCHPSGDFVFCGKQDGAVTEYSAKDGLQICVLYRHATGIAVTSLAFGSKTTIIVSADESGRVMIHQLAFSANQWSTTSLLTDERLEHSVRDLVLSPDNSHVLICAREVIELRAATGERTATIATASQKPQQAIQHPSLENSFIVSNYSVAHIYSWTGLAQLPSEQGIILESNQSTHSNPSTSTTLCGQEIIVQLSKAGHNLEDSTLSCWRSSDFKIEPRPTSIKQQTGFAFLGSKIEHIIAVTGTRLLFLDTDLWVCSLDLKTFGATPQAKRHFFMPSDWQVASGEMLFQFTTKNDFVFAKKHELVIISRGLEFSELVTLSKLQKLNFDLPHHYAPP